MCSIVPLNETVRIFIVPYKKIVCAASSLKVRSLMGYGKGIFSSGSRNLSTGEGGVPMTHETCGPQRRPSFL